MPNFTVENKTFCLSLHYNGDDSYLLVNGEEITKFKAKNYEIKAHPLCLGIISYEYCTSNDFKNYIEMFFILVLIMLLLYQLMTYYIFTNT